MDTNKPKAQKPYTKEEISHFRDDTEIDPKRLPTKTKILWSLFGPPGNTGPK